MSDLHTLRGLMGLPATPAPLSESALIMVDLQNTYAEGIMKLENVEPEGNGNELDKLVVVLPPVTALCSSTRRFFRLLKMSAISESTLFNSRFMPVQDC